MRVVVGFGNVKPAAFGPADLKNAADSNHACLAIDVFFPDACFSNLQGGNKSQSS